MKFAILKRSARTHLLLISASCLPVAASIVLTPFITSSISTLEYGIFVNYLTLSAIVNILVGFSTAGYVSNAYIEPASATQITSSMACFMLLSVVPASVIAGIAAYYSEFTNPLITTVLVTTGIFNYIMMGVQSLSILRRQYGYLLILALAQVGGQYGLVAALLIGSKLSVEGLILANAAGYGLASVIVIMFWRRLGLSFERPTGNTLRRLLLYGLPLVPHMFLSLAVGSFDRWYLISVRRIDDLAVYAVALSISGAVFILLDIINKVYSPIVFDRLKGTGGEALGAYARIIVAFVAAGLVLSLSIAIAGYYFIIYAFDAKYNDAAPLCVSLCLAASAFSLYYSAAPFLYFFNKTSLVLLSSCVGAVATALFSIFSFDALKLNGLIYGKLFGFLVTGIVALSLASMVVNRNRVAQRGLV